MVEHNYSIKVPFLGRFFEIILKLTNTQYKLWKDEDFDILLIYERDDKDYLYSDKLKVIEGLIDEFKIYQKNKIQPK